MSAMVMRYGVVIRYPFERKLGKRPRRVILLSIQPRRQANSA